ncbi:MAG: alkaline phosphatase family protein [Gemmatimonadales bacterium]
MNRSNCVDRVVVVVLDGLRADAVPLFPLPAMRALARRGAHTYRGLSVQPSITVSALTSLLTGASPEVHRLRSDHHLVTRSIGPLHPIPMLLSGFGIPTYCHLAALPFYARGIGARVAAQLGAMAYFGGDDADAIVGHALTRLQQLERGLVLVHLPDADDAGHAAGWMSPTYRRAALGLDTALERLVRETGVLDDPRTVLIALADHGGGGVDPHHHNSAHPLDMTIPIMFLGARIAPHELPAGTSLLDVAATIPWLLGVEAPASYTGRVMRDVIHGSPHIMPSPVEHAAAAA